MGLADKTVQNKNISELENRAIDSSQYETRRKKRLKRIKRASMTHMIY